MRRGIIVAAVAGLLVAALSGTSVARDRPFSTAKLIAMKWGPAPEERDLGTGGGNTDPGGQFSVEQIERFRCASAGNPAAAVDISCNTTEYNQDWNPDNEIAVAVDPTDPEPHRRRLERLLLPLQQLHRAPARRSSRPGSSPRSTAGATWIDGQIPMRTGNGAGDPSPAFDRSPRRRCLMAQLENTGGQGGAVRRPGRRLGQPLHRRRRRLERADHRLQGPGRRDRPGQPAPSSTTRSG